MVAQGRPTCTGGGQLTWTFTSGKTDHSLAGWQPLARPDKILPFFSETFLLRRTLRRGLACCSPGQAGKGVEVLNDINGDLVKICTAWCSTTWKSSCQFKWALSSQTNVQVAKKPGETLTDIQRAARFYLMQNCFSGKVGRADVRHSDNFPQG